MPSTLVRRTTAYTAPFIVFMAFLAIRSSFPVDVSLEYPLRVIVVSTVWLAVSRGVFQLRFSNPVGSVLLGAAVFLLWVGPDLIWPGYRSHWLFANALTNTAAASPPPAARADLFFLVFRVLGAAVLVPIIEELFWRGWLMRWVITKDFESVPLGTRQPASFWITAVLFASEHGSFWGVGLLAGVAYNWWMLRTRNLADCILAHAVTNACLAGYVLLFGRWEYWA
jgi:uncharacterized protein